MLHLDVTLLVYMLVVHHLLLLLLLKYMLFLFFAAQLEAEDLLVVDLVSGGLEEARVAAPVPTHLPVSALAHHLAHAPVRLVLLYLASHLL